MENSRPDTQLTERQSIELITAMIQDTRMRLARNSGVPFLVWGYVTVAVSIFEFFAMRNFSDPVAWQWGWWAIPVLGIAGMFLFARKQEGAKNYIDRTISAVWLVCGTAIFTIAVALSVFFRVPMHFSVVAFIGMGTAITGRIIRNGMTTAAGFLFMLSALVFPLRSMFFGETASDATEDMMRWYSVNALIFAAIFFIFMVVPGHVLNRKSNRACSRD